MMLFKNYNYNLVLNYIYVWFYEYVLMWFYESYILLSNFSILIIVILNIKDIFNDLKVLIIVFIFIYFWIF